MLTYDFQNIDGPIYEYIYKCIKEDILSGNIRPGEKLPSKRTFANNHGISTITIQNAYDQLISEGYVYTLPKRGYYAAELPDMATRPSASGHISYDIAIPEKKEYKVDFSGNAVSSDNFPFSIWTRISREVLATKKEELMIMPPVCGVEELRSAIAEHLKSFRGMIVDPNQIIVGAGTEYLYGLITELLGNDKTYAIETPGYKKLAQIYRQRGISCQYASMDRYGVTVEGLERSEAQVAHICPNHHFPTGITMPASRRYEVLAWANASDSRYIIEDDYDSEFRTEGKPIPTLFSIDACEKVIYMNTFSKSLSPTIRISYMVLPVHLVKKLFAKMDFYSCTVSNFEQYTLAEFIRQGFFEKHINRMRLYYMRKRRQVMDIIQNSGLVSSSEILENDSGLHFLLKLQTTIPDETIENRLLEQGIRIQSLSDYDLLKEEDQAHYFIINYSNLNMDVIEDALKKMEEVLETAG
ncbi:MAG: PLP-dependent aminotransferase family protein [Lachnospiraceae bacterium]|nr:PLP-dependent aminotransferase family protein [Lachnospiraceae bacterium]